MRRHAIPALCVLLAIAGCGGGGGSGLSQDLAATHANYQIIDLEAGTAQAADSVPGLATDPAYRDRLLVVRRLPRRTATTGQTAGSWAAQPDETPASAELAPCYLAVFELTRAQWRRLAGDEPWTLVLPATLAGPVVGDELPAVGIAHQRAVAVLAARRARGLDLRLPGDADWESAARAGGALFPWGDARDATTVAAAAVVAETAGGVLGPQPVGVRAVAPSGCFDLVGNAAEWTAEGNLRGGSWTDALSLARPANLQAAELDVPYAHAGVRVLYQPPSR